MDSNKTSQETPSNFVLNINHHSTQFFSQKLQAYLPNHVRSVYRLICDLSQLKGYCFATNAFIADSLGLTKRTTERHIQFLVQNGHIKNQFNGQHAANHRTPDYAETMRQFNLQPVFNEAGNLVKMVDCESYPQTRHQDTTLCTNKELNCVDSHDTDGEQINITTTIKLLTTNGTLKNCTGESVMPHATPERQSYQIEDLELDGTFKASAIMTFQARGISNVTDPQLEVMWLNWQAENISCGPKIQTEWLKMWRGWIMRENMDKYKKPIEPSKFVMSLDWEPDLDLLDKAYAYLELDQISPYGMQMMLAQFRAYWSMAKETEQRTDKEWIHTLAMHIEYCLQHDKIPAPKAAKLDVVKPIRRTRHQTASDAAEGDFIAKGINDTRTGVMDRAKAHRAPEGHQQQRPAKPKFESFAAQQSRARRDSVLFELGLINADGSAKNERCRQILKEKGYDNR